MKFVRIVLKSLVLSVSLAGIAQADTFALDPAHTMALFKINHMGISPLYGRFNDVSGTFEADAQGALTSVSIKIKSTSVDTQVRRRDDHLRSADFFNAAQFPEINFNSTSVSAVSDSAFDVTGNLALHGVTKSITIRVNRTAIVDLGASGFHIGAESTFAISRSAFGMNSMLNAAGDEVTLIFAVDGVRR